MCSRELSTEDQSLRIDHKSLGVKKPTMLTAETFKSRYRYNPETGLVTILRFNRVIGADDGRGYLKIMIDGKGYLVHRLAFLYMTGEWPTQQVDHIDRNKANNRWSNLRDVSHWDNQQNKSPRKIYVLRVENGVCDVYFNSVKIFTSTNELEAMNFIETKK